MLAPWFFDRNRTTDRGEPERKR